MLYYAGMFVKILYQLESVAKKNLMTVCVRVINNSYG